MSQRLRFIFLPTVLLSVLFLYAGGCNTLFPGHIVPDKLWPSKKEKDPLLDNPFAIETEDGRPKLVGDHVSIGNFSSIPVHGFGLVVGLPGTGGEDINTLPYQKVQDRLNRDKVTGIRALLARPDTAVVEIRGQMRPGIQRGDRFDVQVLLPPNTHTRSLRGGVLMPTNLTEMAAFGNDLGVGSTRAVVQGPIMVDDPMATEMNDPDGLKRGTILSGAVTGESRALSLIMKEKSFVGVDRIAKAINDRFPLNTGPRTGVASAETSALIILNVHPSYANDIDRYIRVVQAIACFETPERQRQRIERLKSELLVPETSQHAAFQLEAIGRQGVDALSLGLQSPNMEVRFHAATSLAYLDNGAAAKVLAEIAQAEPAFRVYALNGLSVMKNDLEAEFHLRQLLHVPCEETRYGAFRALKNRNPLDLTIRGEILGGYFGYHVIPTQAPPMVHITTQKLPEIVLFGTDVFVRQPFVLDAGPTVFVNGQEPGRVAVTQFAKSGIDERREVSNRLDEIIRAVVELGGSYPDVVQLLRQADMSGMLSCSLETDRLPEPNRVFRRQGSDYAVYEEEERAKTFWDRMNPRHLMPSNMQNIFAPNPGGTSSDYTGTVNRSGRD